MFRVVELNDALATARYCGEPFKCESDAIAAAIARIGNPDRKRKFYAVAVDGPDGRREISRGRS